MKNSVIKKLGSLLLISFSFLACGEEENDSFNTPGERIPAKVRSGLDLSQINSETSDGILMQAFYWDVEPIGEWYNTVTPMLKNWADNGVNRIWLAPPGKGQSGGFSMGYDPCDYFDLGEYDQHGSVRTRFGTKEELIALIDEAHNNDLEVIADIVLNHNSGGQSEANPNTGTNTFTNYTSPSGFFPRTFDDFYPDSEGNEDEGRFGGFADLNHSKPNVQNWLWRNENSVAKYYKSIGFDGWRFDFVKGFSTEWIKAWNAEVGGTSIGENFDGNADVLRRWTSEAESAAFDFACFFKLDEALDRNNDLTILSNNDRDMLRKTNPELAFTFTANHDTDGRDEVGEDGFISPERKMLAYSYILTHDGKPTIFISDYENFDFREDLQRLMEIHNSIASGEVNILLSSRDTYVMRREGSNENPGLIYTMNITNETKNVVVQTNWENTILFDYTRNVQVEPQTQDDGKITLAIPPNSYGVWSVAN